MCCAVLPYSRMTYWESRHSFMHSFIQDQEGGRRKGRHCNALMPCFYRLLCIDGPFDGADHPFEVGDSNTQSKSCAKGAQLAASQHNSRSEQLLSVCPQTRKPDQLS